MIVLRLLSLLSCSLLLIVLPIVLAIPGGRFPLQMALPAALCVALTAAGFVYVGMTAERMLRAGFERRLGMALLALPAMTCLAVLATRHEALLLWSSALLLGCTLLTLAGLLNPAALEPDRRVLRRRERREPILPA